MNTKVDTSSKITWNSDLHIRELRDRENAGAGLTEFEAAYLEILDTADRTGLKEEKKALTAYFKKEFERKNLETQHRAAIAKLRADRGRRLSKDDMKNLTEVGFMGYEIDELRIGKAAMDEARRVAISDEGSTLHDLRQSNEQHAEVAS